MDDVLTAILAEMADAGYGERDRFAVRLSFEEAITNALKHGNRGDPGKRVSVQWQVEDEQVLAAVEDQGAGFDPDRLPDPFAPENLEKPSGRGVLLMRYYLSWVRYNERGNRVTLCKQRAG
jgi:serine/threonine-protein kinase RsbW